MKTPAWLQKVQWAGWVLALMVGLSTWGIQSPYATKAKVSTIEEKIQRIDRNLVKIMTVLEIEPVRD